MPPNRNFFISFKYLIAFFQTIRSRASRVFSVFEMTYCRRENRPQPVPARLSTRCDAGEHEREKQRHASRIVGPMRHPSRRYPALRQDVSDKEAR